MLAAASHRQTLSSSHSPSLGPSLAPPLPPRPRLQLPRINSIPPVAFTSSQHPNSFESRPPNASPALTLPPPNYAQTIHHSSMHNHHQFPSESDRLPPLVHHDGDSRMLPSLSSITGDMAAGQHRSLHSPPPPPLQPNHWPASFNGSSAASLNAYRQPPPLHAPDSPATLMDMDGAASIASAASPSPERLYDGTPTPSSLTLDDPDVRLAAEALGDLRAGA